MASNTARMTTAQRIRKLDHIGFMWVLFMAQMIAMIALAEYLPGLSWQVCMMYIVLTMGVIFYTKDTEIAARSIKLRDVVYYGIISFTIAIILCSTLYMRSFYRCHWGQRHHRRYGAR